MDILNASNALAFLYAQAVVAEVVASLNIEEIHCMLLSSQLQWE